ERLRRELDEELRFHRGMLERDARSARVPEHQIAYAIAAQLGNATYYREESQDMWSLGVVDDVIRDIHYALRALRATPGFSLIVTLVLALGIGATTAIYTVVDGILL